MRVLLLLALTSFAACKPDPAPARSEAVPVIAAATPARHATLPAPTRTNALHIAVQLRAEQAFADASASDTSEAWDLAADLFARARDACTADCSELAYATVLARANALKGDETNVPDEKPTTPQPLPARVEALIAAADTYVAGASPGDDDAVGVAFLAGREYNDFGWIDESTTRFGALVVAHPTHEVALYSANLLLDAYNRSGRFEDLVRWARDLAANATLMATHAELAETVHDILARAEAHHE